MASQRPGALLRLLGCLVVIGLLAGVLVLGAALLQSSVAVVHSEPAGAERELDAAVARFAGQRPYVDIEHRDGVLAAVVHHELEPATPARITMLRGLMWDAPGRRLLRAATPLWVFDFTRWKAAVAGALVEPIEQRLGLDVRLPDLAPFGPGLVLDHRFADGRRVVIWAQGD